MKPALSVIFFTVVSGTGYGLLFLFGLVVAADPAYAGRGQSLTILMAGTCMVIAGLISSTLHLGQPRRAWRAFSQWHSSWLSREGVSALLSLMPIAALLADLWIHANATLLGRIAAIVTSLLALITVICTAKIYSSLKTIRAWCNPYVLPGYLLLAAFGGSACLLAIDSWFAGAFTNPFARAGDCLLLTMLVAFSYVWKRIYWRHLDNDPHPVATTGHATGLERFGTARSAEAPHSEENYLTREMGFRLARKHASKLRELCLLLIGPLTGIAALGVLVTAPGWPLAAQICALAGVAFALLGLFIERWLFFAEARHVVMSYYGR